MKPGQKIGSRNDQEISGEQAQKEMKQKGYHWSNIETFAQSDGKNNSMASTGTYGQTEVGVVNLFECLRKTDVLQHAIKNP